MDPPKSVSLQDLEIRNNTILQLTMQLSKNIISQKLSTTFCSFCYFHSCL